MIFDLHILGARSEVKVPPRIVTLGGHTSVHSALDLISLTSDLNILPLTYFSLDVQNAAKVSPRSLTLDNT